MFFFPLSSIVRLPVFSLAIGNQCIFRQSRNSLLFFVLSSSVSSLRRKSSSSSLVIDLFLCVFRFFCSPSSSLVLTHGTRLLSLSSFLFVLLPLPLFVLVERILLVEVYVQCMETPSRGPFLSVLVEAGRCMYTSKTSLVFLLPFRLYTH